jgi:uncharacterized protein YjbI with pentapeptide repeats
MIQIKHRYTGAVLFECEEPDGVESGLWMRHAVEKATYARADLSGANLSGANLSRAYLSGADLSGANLSRADLSRADLSGADLSRAYLSRADLSGADLSGAKIDDKTLIGTRSVMQIGPIGSRSDYLVSYMTDAGVMVKAGCFFGTMDEFAAAVEKTHGDSDHGKEYRTAILMIESHAAIWWKK